MASKNGTQIIAIEEHYFDPELAAHFEGRNDIKAPPIRQRLDDLGELRIKEMDEAGIDVQVLSHGAPATQRLDAETAGHVLELRSDLTGDRACGAIPINGLLIAARRRALRGKLLDLRNSGDTAGDHSRVVGYGAFAFSNN